MRMELVLFEGRAFAYAQSYDVHAWPQPHLEHLPAGGAPEEEERERWREGFREALTK